MIYLLCEFLLLIPYFVFLHPRIRGLKNLYFKGPAIIVSNHWSIADPVLLAMLCPRFIHYMGKAELFEKPLTRMLMKGLMCFPVEKGAAASLSSMRQAGELLEKGKIFGIFPEGHRTLTDELDDMSRGAAFLAVRCKVPVIPVYSDPYTQKNFHSRMDVGTAITAEEAVRRYGGKPVDAVTKAIQDSLQVLRWQQEGIRR